MAGIPKINVMQIMQMVQKFATKPESAIEFLGSYIGQAISFLEDHYQTKINLQFFNYTLKDSDIEVQMIGIVDMNRNKYIETIPFSKIIEFIKTLDAEKQQQKEEQLELAISEETQNENI